MNLKILKYNLYLMGILSGLIWALGGDKKPESLAEKPTQSRSPSGALELDEESESSQIKKNTVEGQANSKSIVRSDKKSKNKKKNNKEATFLPEEEIIRNPQELFQASQQNGTATTLNFSGVGFASKTSVAAVGSTRSGRNSSSNPKAKMASAESPVMVEEAVVEISLINNIEELHSYKENVLRFTLSQANSLCSDVALTFDSVAFSPNDFVISQEDLDCVVTINMSRNVAASSYLMLATAGDAKTIGLDIVGVDSIDIVKNIPAKIPKKLSFPVYLEATLSNGEKIIPETGVDWTVNDKFIKNANMVIAEIQGQGLIEAGYQFLTASEPVEILEIKQMYLSSYLTELPVGIEFSLDSWGVLSDDSVFKLTNYSTYTTVNQVVSFDAESRKISTLAEGVGELFVSFDTLNTKSIVKVNNKQIDFMRIVAQELMGVGLADKVSMELVYQDASVQDVSSLVNVISANADVLVYAKPEATGVSVGQSSLSTSFNNDLVEKTIEVQDLVLQDLDLKEKNLLAYKNQTVQLNVLGKYSNGQWYPLKQDFVVSASASPQYSLVNGVLTVVNPTNVYGSVNISVTSGTLSKSFTIFYSPVTLTGYEIIASPSMKKHTKQDLFVIANLSDGGVIDVTEKAKFSVNNQMRANVQATILTSLDLGAVAVTAEINNQTLTKNINISDSDTELSGAGLFAEYYQGMNFNTKKGERIDSNINFYWSNNLNSSMGLQDSYSIRWTGSYIPRVTENIIFCLDSDDGARMWANNQQIINNWTNHSVVRNCSASISVVKNVPVSIKVEYYENRGFSEIRMYKGTAPANVQIIPKNNLLPY